MIRLFTGLYSSFTGLSKEVWWLAFITLINRAGTMVIPFLSLYLTKGLGYTLSDVGWVMTSFGLGSVVGSWLGGKLTDRFGAYKIMVFSLVLSAVFFVLLQYLTSFWFMCAGVFLVLAAADLFRPAMFVALKAYSKPQNKTRSVTLIRLAINLGFSLGPAAGGFIIATVGYSGLFWIDGVTCFLAAILLLQTLNPKRAQVLDSEEAESPRSAYSDKSFWIFFAAMALFGFTFLQYFSTIPLYYKDVHLLSEQEIGLLLGFNGLVIFILEMPLIKYCENRSPSKMIYMLYGTVLLALSFAILNMSSWVGVLLIGMVLMSVGEMLVFPFSNAWAMDRSKRGRAGQYMALYTIAFSLSHIFGHNSGMQLIDAFGYPMTWNIMTALTVLCVVLILVLRYRLRKENPAELNP